MNKVFCNKETDMVEQIINIDVDNRWDESWFPHCYVIDDEFNAVQTYNLKYNRESKKFEVVEGKAEKDEVKVIKSEFNGEIESLKKENEDLKSRLDKLEALLG